MDRCNKCLHRQSHDQAFCSCITIEEHEMMMHHATTLIRSQPHSASMHCASSARRIDHARQTRKARQWMRRCLRWRIGTSWRPGILQLDICWAAQSHGHVKCHLLPRQGRLRQGHHNEDEPQQRPHRIRNRGPHSYVIAIAIKMLMLQTCLACVLPAGHIASKSLEVLPLYGVAGQARARLTQPFTSNLLVIVTVNPVCKR